MLDLVIYAVWLATTAAFISLAADTIVRHWRITRRNRAIIERRLRVMQASPRMSVDMLRDAKGINGRID